MTEEQYLKVLPEFLQDFHDQKDFFKAMHYHYNKGQSKVPNNWVDNHVYTIDFFLWFMAQHGYRLQRFKSNHFTQYDINLFVKSYTDGVSDQFAKILNLKP